MNSRNQKPVTSEANEVSGVLRSDATKENQKLKARNQKNILFLLILFSVSSFLFSSLTGCGKKSSEELTKIPVDAITIKRGGLKEILSYVGDIKAEDEAVVYPRVTGKIIEEVAKEGDKVKRGDVLAYIDRDEVGFQFEKAPAESPIDGIVGMLYIDRGTDVSPQTPIALVVNMDAVKVAVNVVERDLPKVKVGQTSEITTDAYPDEIFKGTVERVSPVVDLTSRTASLEIKIPNHDHRLKPGMFARIRILIKEREDVLIVPRDAIVKEDSSDYVFVVRDGNKVSYRKIEAGLCEDNKFEVLNGLNEGELVVTMGNTRLKDGDTVEIVEEVESRK